MNINDCNHGNAIAAMACIARDNDNNYKDCKIT